MIVMVHTARTALPATLAAVLSRATMWLSGLCIYLHTWSVQGTPSVMLQQCSLLLPPQGSGLKAVCAFVSFLYRCSLVCLESFMCIVPVKPQKPTDNTDKVPNISDISEHLGHGTPHSDFII